MMQLSLSLVSTFLAATAAAVEYTFVRAEFSSRQELEAETSHLRQVLNTTRHLLRMASILDPWTTARQFVDVEQRGEWDRLVAGIMIENYSKYKLEDPRVSTSDCKASREINAVLPVQPGTQELFLYDNDAWNDRGVCGTLTWEVRNGDGSPVAREKEGGGGSTGRRLVVTFYVPWSGSCGEDGRTNSFSMNVWYAHLNSEGKWKQPELVESYFSVDHDDSGSSGFVDDGSPAAALFDDGRFLVAGSMERGCKPILTVSFLPGSRYKRMLWSKDEEEREDAEELTDQEEESEEAKSDEKGGISQQRIIFCALGAGLGLVAVVVLAFVVRRAAVGRNRKSARDAPFF